MDIESNAPKRAHGELGPCLDKDCGYDTCISQREELAAAIARRQNLETDSKQ